jgi:hypothetical protein
MGINPPLPAANDWPVGLSTHPTQQMQQPAPPRPAPPVRVQHFRFLQVDESLADEHLAASRCGTSPCPGASARGGVPSSTATACCVPRRELRRSCRSASVMTKEAGSMREY